MVNEDVRCGLGNACIQIQDNNKGFSLVKPLLWLTNKGDSPCEAPLMIVFLQWDEYYTQVEAVAANVPYMVCPGNHESDSPNST